MLLPLISIFLLRPTLRTKNTKCPSLYAILYTLCITRKKFQYRQLLQ
jgi:hypothetical protein